MSETEQRIVNINVDEDYGFFKKAELNKDEIWYLLDKGYKISSHVGLNGGVRKYYLLKPRFNETASHFFLVKAIENLIRKYTDKVWLYETKKPDIVFERNKKKIAVEVETGLKIKKDIKHIKEKVNMLNENYRKWFFVVTNRDYKKYYEMFGTTYLRTEIPQIMKKLFWGNPCEEFEKEAENEWILRNEA